MTRRVEVNPGELFLVGDPTILVREWETIIGDVEKIGGPGPDLAYLLTFTGRRNNSDEVVSFTAAISPEDAFALAGQILDGIELLLAANRDAP